MWAEIGPKDQKLILSVFSAYPDHTATGMCGELIGSLELVQPADHANRVWESAKQESKYFSPNT